MPPPVTQTQAPLPDWLELVSKVDAKIRSLSNTEDWKGSPEINQAKIDFLKKIKELLKKPTTTIVDSLGKLASNSPNAFYKKHRGISSTERIFNEIYSTYQALAKKRDELVEKTKPFSPNINLDDITMEGELSNRYDIQRINTFYKNKDNIGIKISRKEGFKYSVMRVEGDDGNIHTLTFYRSLKMTSNLYSSKSKKKKGGVLAIGRSPLRPVLVESEINGVKKIWWGACKVITNDLLDDIEREAKAMRDIALPHTQDAFAFYRKRKSSKEPFKRGIVFPLLNGTDFYDYRANYSFRLTINNFSLFYSDIIKQIIITHKKDYVHGDIKNENFMCDLNFKGHLCDFGSSRKLEDASKSYDFYSAPEFLPDDVYENHGREYLNYSIDLYTLGAAIKITMDWNKGLYEKTFIVPAGITFPDNKMVDGKLVYGTKQFATPFVKAYSRIHFFTDFSETLDPNEQTLFGPLPELKPLFDYANQLMDYKTNKATIHTAEDAKRLLLQFDQVMNSIINPTPSAPTPSAHAVPPKP